MLSLHGCGPTAQTSENQLADRENQKELISINGKTFETWLALTEPQRQTGLMRVTEEELAPDNAGRQRGMLFVFEVEQPLAFWMLNTITPLDIAYIRTDGKIVKIHTMPALTTRTFPSVEPARYALEVRAGTFAQLGIAEGDLADIPTSVLKR
jgi:hypothetical protein